MSLAARAMRVWQQQRSAVMEGGAHNGGDCVGGGNGGACNVVGVGVCARACERRRWRGAGGTFCFVLLCCCCPLIIVPITTLRRSRCRSRWRGVAFGTEIAGGQFCCVRPDCFRLLHHGARGAQQHLSAIASATQSVGSSFGNDNDNDNACICFDVGDYVGIKSVGNHVDTNYCISVGNSVGKIVCGMTPLQHDWLTTRSCVA